MALESDDTSEVLDNFPAAINGQELSAAFHSDVDSGVGRNYVGPAGITVLAAALVAAMFLAIYGLVLLWPTSGSTGSAASQLVGLNLILDREQRLFIIVALSGFLGGLIHSARSLYEYVGSRLLRRSWLLMYLSLPFIGAALAVVFYVILRGGLITGTAAQVNFFGFASIAALVGLFSPEAAEKLKQVFSTLLAPAPRGQDSLRTDDGPLVLSVQPSAAPAGTMLRIRGRNLAATSVVIFSDDACATATIVSDSEVAVQVPQAARTGRVRVVVGDLIADAPTIFRVES